jgi:predicted TIM-barrel fold metal-dependent hydrolase
MIIDAHIHLPVIPKTRSFELARRLLLADLRRDQIAYAILIPDNVAGSSIGDLETCLPLVEDEPQLFLLGTIDVERQGEEWLGYLETLIETHQIVGLKIFPGHDPVYPTDPRLSGAYALCQAHHVPMVIHTGWNSNDPQAARFNDPKYIIQVAQAYPELPIVIAHYFWPEMEYCYRTTIPYANIHYDTSGLADAEVIQTTGLATIQSVLLKTLQHGPNRVLFGTDYAMCDRPDHIQMVNMLPISEDVRECIFWRNAARLFSLKIRQS